LDDIAAVLVPTFVYVEDNLGARAESLYLCGFGNHSESLARHFQGELGVPVESLHSPWGMPGEYNAGLFGYLRSVGKN
jgi:type IV pilus assembly protein PilM